MSDAPAQPIPPPPRPGDALPPNILPPDRGPTSPLRWLFVLAPVLVILVVGTGLLQRWSSVLQDGIRDLRRWQTEASNAEERRPEEPRAPTADHRRAPSEPSTGDPAAEAEAELDVAAVLARLPDADLELGARYFRMCTICHSASGDAGHKLGPNLWGIAGRRKAAYRDFRYSQALRGIGGTWTDADLAAYLHNPRRYAPGTSMALAGIRDPDKLAGLVAYLHTLSSDPPR